MSTIEALRELKSEMEDSLPGDLFFFPVAWDVQGYWGTGDIVIVGHKPSTGSFPDSHVRLLYGSMVIYEFENAHITDISKERGKGGQEIPPAELDRNIAYFERELDILDPELLVALGEKAEHRLEQLDATDSIELMRVNHYTWGRRYSNEDVFLDHMKDVYQRARELEL